MFSLCFAPFFPLKVVLSVFTMPPLPTLCIAVCSALVATAAAVVGASDISTPAGNWSLVKLQSAATGPEHAVCLDGSPYAFYMRPSITNASDNSKWVVFMEGGGWCGSDANCAQRALTPLGSSTSYGPDPGPTEADALFDDFGDAVAVYAKYCDGGSWTGNVTEPITVGKQQIWYRGRPLLDALLDELLQQGKLVVKDAFSAIWSGFRKCWLAHQCNFRKKMPLYHSRLISVQVSQRLMSYCSRDVQLVL